MTLYHRPTTLNPCGEYKSVEEASEAISMYSTGMNKLHILKTVNPHFMDVWNGHKKAELRSCEDRDFSLDDFLLLREWVPNTIDDGGYFWGHHLIIARITHILSEVDIMRIFGLNTPAMVMLSLHIVDKLILPQKGLDLLVKDNGKIS